MFRCSFARRWITGLSILMLLLCQTTAVTLAYAAPSSVPPAATITVDATAPCHHDAVEADSGTPAHGCQDRCPSRAASFETAKLDVPAAMVTALPAYALATHGTPASRVVRHQPVLARAAPPPLRLVYCRLLN